MSAEKPTRSAKSSTSNPAPPGDHRKRRRNRTTQSCLNCHASKRMVTSALSLKFIPSIFITFHSAIVNVLLAKDAQLSG